MNIKDIRTSLVLIERALETSYKTGAPQQLLMELEYGRSNVLKLLLKTQLREFSHD